MHVKEGTREEARGEIRGKTEVEFLPIVLVLLREGGQLLTGLDLIDGHVLMRTILSLD